MDKMVAAFATNDGSVFTETHFGDADFYDIYEMTADGSKFLERIENSARDSGEESEHGGSEKAGNIASLLKQKGVMISVSLVFGPNLVKIKKKFLCIIVRNSRIDESLKVLVNNFSALVEEWSRGEDRNFLRL